MTEFNASSIDFTFHANEQNEANAAKWNWATTVFGDPLALPPRLSTKFTSQMGDNLEPSLYGDWQTRDKELGFRLLEPRLSPLKMAIYAYHKGFIKRQRLTSFLRSRLDAMEKINQAEPNPALRHSVEGLAKMREDASNAAAEYEYLRNYRTDVDAMERFVAGFGNEGEYGQQGLQEELCRLIGLSWKGLMKVKAFQQRFPHLRYHVASETNSLQFNLPGARNVAGLEILLQEGVAHYLVHCLETIASLAQETIPYFEGGEHKNLLATGWPPPLMLLRAIVELFHYCNFELSYQRIGLFQDRDNPQQIWQYQNNTQQWVTNNNESPADCLKRQAVAIASLIIAPPPFLSCIDPEDLSNYCHAAMAELTATPPAVSHPYWSVGLARLDCDSRTKIFKFQSGYELSAQLIDQLIQTQPHLIKAFQTPLGGSLLTLRGLARFEAAAFNVEKERGWSDEERFKLLGRGWRLLAKHRPLSLLGHDYAKTVYTGMAAFGEPPPERSSLLSMHLSSVFTQFVGNKESLTDPVAALVLADQIRLMELLNESWLFFQDTFSYLQTNSVEQLAQILHQQTLSPAHEPNLAINFHSKWLTATQSIWSLIRGVAPAAWAFWSSIHQKRTLQEMLAILDTAGAINYLFQVAADVARLMLMLEAASPALTEKLMLSAEQATQELLTSFSPFIELPQISTSIPYYFVLEIHHDSWLAFTVSFYRHLKEWAAGLPQNDATQGQLKIIDGVGQQLIVQYPEIDNYVKEPVALPAPVTSPTLVRETCTLQPVDEAMAERLETICQQFLSHNFAPQHLLQLMAMASHPSLSPSVELLSSHFTALSSYIDGTVRPFVVAAPFVLSGVLGILQRGGGGVGDEMRGYLPQVSQFINYSQHLFNSAFADEEAREEVRRAIFSSTASELKFYLLSFLGTTFCTINASDKQTAQLAAIEKIINNRLAAQLPEWRNEVLFIGGGRLHCQNGTVKLSGDQGLNPSFSEPQQPASARLCWYSLKQRFDLMAQILVNEFPGAKAILNL